jgi:hypothetical protein
VYSFCCCLIRWLVPVVWTCERPPEQRARCMCRLAQHYQRETVSASSLVQCCCPPSCKTDERCYVFCRSSVNWHEIVVIVCTYYLVTCAKNQSL